MNLSTDDLEMQAYYAGRAAYYDAVYDQPERARDIALLREWLPSRLAGREVIEVACGTGYWSQHIAPACARYVATDGLTQPLAFARQRPGLQGAQCQVADAYALPSSLGSFDGAFAGLWFSHVPVGRRTEFCASLHALLRPGARVLLLDNSRVQCKDFPVVETDAQGNGWQMRPLRDGSSHRVLKNFPTEPELVAMARSLGGTNWAYREFENFWSFEYELS